jgi:hypothetical protein
MASLQPDGYAQELVASKGRGVSPSTRERVFRQRYPPTQWSTNGRSLLLLRQGTPSKWTRFLFCSLNKSARMDSNFRAYLCDSCGQGILASNTSNRLRLGRTGIKPAPPTPLHAAPVLYIMLAYDRTRGRYCSASGKCAAWMCSHPAKSAIAR